MKKVKLLLTLTFLLVVLQTQAQGLKTVKTYHDLWGTKLHEIYTVVGAGGQKHGTYKAYDNEGFIYAMITYSKGIKNGPWKYYGFDNGGREDREKVREEGNYLNGKEHGRYVYYNLINGKRQLSTEKLYDNGNAIEETWYYDNGNKRNYKCSNGVAYEWYLNGALKQESNMKDDSYEGEVKEYYENGTLQKLSNYKQGNFNGAVEEYYENGKLNLIQHYSEGLSFGESVKYNEDGTINWRMLLKSPNQAEQFTAYFRNGNKFSESILTANNNYLTTRYDSLSSVKTAELIQVFNQVFNRSNESLSGKGYYPNGRIEEEWTQVREGQYEANHYKEDGILDYKIDKNGTTIYYHPNQAVAQKVYLRNERGWQSCEDFDQNGELIKKRQLNKDNQLLSQEDFSKGICTYRYKDGIENWYYPNGQIKKTCNLNDAFEKQTDVDDSIVFEYDEFKKIISRSTRNGKYWVYNYPENMSLLQSKGEKDENGNHISKWYLYTEKGKLKIEENGTVRKPTKEEKLNHASYLQNLINAKP